jgi:thiosulfate/3-mercaptopyruvate sulfurtransferase
MSATDDPLVSTEWLARRLNDPSVKILDATFKLPGVMPLPIEDYRAAHIPGAMFFDVDAVADRSSELPHMFPDAPGFASSVGALGVSSEHTVVVYDAGGWVAAPRAWWMFRAFGHANVRVLDGGLQKWRAEQRPLESGDRSAEPAVFVATFDPSFVADLQATQQAAESGIQVLDARPAARFEGRAPEPRPGLRAGHIPGSRNLPHAELFDPATGTMKPLDQLRDAFTAAGVDPTAPVIASCGSGVSAAVPLLALYRLGARGNALFDASWAQWGAPDGPPLATVTA